MSTAMAANNQSNTQPNLNEYKFVSGHVEEDQPLENNVNEIRCISMRPANIYSTFAVNRLRGEQDTITLHALGQAISTCILAAEQIKKQIPNLHQITEFDTHHVVDHYEPTVQGRQPLDKQRNVGGIKIILSKSALDNQQSGYQGPAKQRQQSNTETERQYDSDVDESGANFDAE
jgi:DNA-binding protein